MFSKNLKYYKIEKRYVNERTGRFSRSVFYDYQLL